jgi:hypothetical protein
MRIYTNGTGVTVIDQDEEVTARIGALNPSDPTWTYPDGTVLDVRGLRCNVDVLTNLYAKACYSKQPVDSAAYMKHKARVIASFNKRDQTGSRYE